MSRTFRTFWRSLIPGLAMLGLGGCSIDAPTAPVTSHLPVAADPGLLGDLYGGLVTKKPLRRDEPLARDITVRAVIGSAGGRVELPGQGFTLIVPRGAVRSDTRFEVTAIAGDLVAYEFEPHGTKFREPLIATQELDGTRFELRLLPSLTAGYFRDRDQLFQPDGTILLTELINGITLPLTREFKWKIEHFSGYIVAF
jgi:hypothetical protein